MLIRLPHQCMHPMCNGCHRFVEGAALLESGIQAQLHVAEAAAPGAPRWVTLDAGRLMAGLRLLLDASVVETPPRAEDACIPLLAVCTRWVCRSRACIVNCQ